MSLPTTESQEIPENLFAISSSLFPIKGGSIRPLTGVSEASLEQLGLQLDASDRFKLTGSFVIGLETDCITDSNDEYSVRKFLSRLAADKLFEDDRRFIGPLFMQDRYWPKGIGVWELLPEEEDK